MGIADLFGRYINAMLLWVHPDLINVGKQGTTDTIEHIFYPVSHLDYRISAYYSLREQKRIHIHTLGGYLN